MRHFLLHVNINFYIPFQAMLSVPAGRTGGRGKPHDRHACDDSCSCHSGHDHTGDESGCHESGCQCHCQEVGHECRCRHEEEKR